MYDMLRHVWRMRTALNLKPAVSWRITKRACLEPLIAPKREARHRKWTGSTKFNKLQDKHNKRLTDSSTSRSGQHLSTPPLPSSVTRAHFSPRTFFARVLYANGRLGRCCPWPNCACRRAPSLLQARDANVCRPAARAAPDA